MKRIRSVAAALVLFGLIGPGSASAGTLVFSAPGCDDHCANGIWTMQDDGTGARQLTEPKSRSYGIFGDPSASDSAATWSPDGTRIGFFRSGAEPREEDGLSFMNADGSDARYLNLIAGISDWSRDGQLILFSGYGNEDAGGVPDQPTQNPIQIGDSDVFTIGTDGSGLTRIVNSPIEDSGPRYSADGQRIIFSRGLYGGFPDARTGTYSVALDGSDERRLAFGPPGRVSYSPDGTYGAYGWAGRLWVMKADGSQRRDRTPPGYYVHGWDQFVWGTDAGSSGPILFFGGVTLESVNTGQWDSAMFRLDAGTPDQPASLIRRGARAASDWTPAPDDPRARFVDHSAPAAFFLPSPQQGKTASAAVSRVLSRRSPGLVASDASGIRRIRLAFARKVRRRGVSLCRFAGPDGLGTARRCDRPLYIRGSSEQQLLAPLARLRRGVYQAGFSTVDVLRNRSGRLRLRPVPLR